MITKFYLILILFFYPFVKCNSQVPNYNWRIIETDADSGFNRITLTDSVHGWLWE